MVTVTATRHDQPGRPEPVGVEWGRPPASEPLRGGAGKFTTLSRKKHLQGQVGKAGGSKANLPGAHFCFFAAARAELLVTPGRVDALFMLLSL